MKNIQRWLAVAGMVSVLAFTSGNALAQQQGGGRRGNFDPEQMRQRMSERMREALDIKSDEEWKVLQPRIEKINEARRAIGFGGARMMFGPPRGGENNDQGNRPRFGGEPNPDAEALQKAIDAKASSEEIKTKLAKYRDSKKQKEADLAKAQDELRKLVSVRQEATLVLMGVLQ